MRRSSTVRAALAAAGVVTLLLTPVPAQAAGSPSIALVDAAPDGTPGNGGDSVPDISGNGRYVAFVSDSSNLVASNLEDRAGVFLRDTRTGVTTLVSGGLNGQPANDSTLWGVAISGNGRYVAFASDASNLVRGDTNGASDVFVYDRRTKATTRASVFAGGRQIPGTSSGATISADGRYVAFLVNASDRGTDDQGAALDGQAAFVRDLRTGTTTRVSLQADGGTDLTVLEAVISGNGKRVAFTGEGDWVGDGGTQYGVFVHDLASGWTVRANVPATADEGYPPATGPSISRDGSKVSWQSADPYLPQDTNQTTDIYVRDLRARTTVLASANRAGTGSGNDYSLAARLTADGRYVAFWSRASDLVADDANGPLEDVFLRNLRTGRTTVLSNTVTGLAGDGASFNEALSARGGRVVFMSNATNLGVDPGDGHTHLFVRRLPER